MLSQMPNEVGIERFVFQIANNLNLSRIFYYQQKLIYRLENKLYLKVLEHFLNVTLFIF